MVVPFQFFIRVLVNCVGSAAFGVPHSFSQPVDLLVFLAVGVGVALGPPASLGGLWALWSKRWKKRYGVVSLN